MLSTVTLEAIPLFWQQWLLFSLLSSLYELNTQNIVNPVDT